MAPFTSRRRLQDILYIADSFSASLRLSLEGDGGLVGVVLGIREQRVGGSRFL